MVRAPKAPKKAKAAQKKAAPKIPPRVAAPEKGFMSDGLLVELEAIAQDSGCLLYTSPSPRDRG